MMPSHAAYDTYPDGCGVFRFRLWREGESSLGRLLCFGAGRGIVVRVSGGAPLRSRLGLPDPAVQGLAGVLVSVAGLVGRPVRASDGALVGRLADVVVRAEGVHPRVAGFVVVIGQRSCWLHAEDVAGLEQGRMELARSRFDLVDVQRRSGEILLVADVIDHQLVDVAGVRVVRASELYLTRTAGQWHLVGVDVSWRSFLRRSLPGGPSRRPTPGQVLDWAGVHSLAAVIGPGLIAGLSDDDPAGITTYSVLGASYGYQLLWVLLVSTVALICSRTSARESVSSPARDWPG